jgi:dTDP-4-amino-4,6-dideoxygalactose transaminase
MHEIRFLALERDFEEMRAAYLDATDAVLRSGRVVGGPRVTEFESAIAARTGRRHAIAVASGSDALWVALEAAGIGPGSIVAMPALSYIASGTSLRRTGARPCFVETDLHGHIDPGSLCRLESQQIDALVCIGLYGDGLDDQPLVDFAHRRGIPIIEDAAQSFGARHRHCNGGALGIASALSFAPTKPLACFGNAGAVTTDDDGIAERARLLRNHGKSASSAPSNTGGGNSALASIHAAQLLVSLSRFDERQRRRHEIATAYGARLSNLPEVGLPRVRTGCVHNWHKYAIRSDRRGALAEFLRTRGIEPQVHYPLLLPDEPVLRRARVETDDDFRNAREIAETTLSLPLHPHLHDSEVDRIAQAVRDFFDG